jgi:signal transduction histidine kinase
VSLKAENGTARFTVTHRGWGNPKDKRQRIFEPFHRPAADAGGGG